MTASEKSSPNQKIVSMSIYSFYNNTWEGPDNNHNTVGAGTEWKDGISPKELKIHLKSIKHFMEVTKCTELLKAWLLRSGIWKKVFYFTHVLSYKRILTCI